MLPARTGRTGSLRAKTLHAEIVRGQLFCGEPLDNRVDFARREYGQSPN